MLRLIQGGVPSHDDPRPPPGGEPLGDEEVARALGLILGRPPLRLVDDPDAPPGPEASVPSGPSTST